MLAQQKISWKPEKAQFSNKPDKAQNTKVTPNYFLGSGHKASGLWTRKSNITKAEFKTQKPKLSPFQVNVK